MKRRQFLQTTAATWVAAIANPVSALPVETTTPPAFDLDELTIADLQQKLFARFPKLAEMRNSMLIAVGVDYQPKSYGLKAGDEVSLFPPVQGG